MSNSQPHAPATRQLRLCRRALQEKSVGLAPSQRQSGDSSNTPEETDYQEPSANLTPPEAAIVATNRKPRNIRTARRAPADHNAASVQPMKHATGIQSSSRRRPKEESDDVDAVARPNQALGFHPKSKIRGRKRMPDSTTTPPRRLNDVHRRRRRRPARPAKLSPGVSQHHQHPHALHLR